MTGRTPEERRTALVDQLAAVLMPPLGNDVREWPESLAALHRSMPGDSIREWVTAVDLARRRMDAEAVLGVLESGAAGVYLLAGADLQGSVGVVLAQLREARTLLHDIAVARRGDCPDVDIEPEELPDEIRADHRAWKREQKKVEKLAARLEARERVLTGERNRARIEAGEAVTRAVAAEAEVARLRLAAATTAHEVDQILGRALGYPEYGPEMFPDARPTGDVCTGDHSPESLAKEAAERLGELGTELVSLRVGRIRGRDEVLALAREGEHGASRWEEPLDVPSWVPAVRAILGAPEDRCPCTPCQGADERRARARGGRS